MTVIFPRYDPGAELGYTGLFGPQPFGIPTSYFKYFVLNDTSFQLSDLNYDLVLQAKERNVGQLVSVNPDITAFTKRGGKLLQYHGLADQLIPCKSDSAVCSKYVTYAHQLCYDSGKLRKILRFRRCIHQNEWQGQDGRLLPLLPCPWHASLLRWSRCQFYWNITAGKSDVAHMDI